VQEAGQLSARFSESSLLFRYITLPTRHHIIWRWSAMLLSILLSFTYIHIGTFTITPNETSAGKVVNVLKFSEEATSVQ
jgi:hypothetical protein